MATSRKTNVQTRRMTRFANVPTRFAKRTISRSVYESLHIGLKRMGKLWEWNIVEDSELTEESNALTREELGLAPVKPETNEEGEEEKVGNNLLSQDVLEAG